jgi:hypothetical protein
MRLLIHDANVLIDLLDIGLLDEAMRIPCVMETIVRPSVKTAIAQK